MGAAHVCVIRYVDLQRSRSQSRTRAAVHCWYVKQHSSWHSSKQSERSLLASFWQRGTQSLRHDRYFGSFLVPSSLSLDVGRSGSLLPESQSLGTPSLPAIAAGVAAPARAAAANAGNAARRDSRGPLGLQAGVHTRCAEGGWEGEWVNGVDTSSAATGRRE